MGEKIVRVVAPHFCAAMIMGDDEIVTDAAPILRWAIGKKRSFLSAYFQIRGWRATIIPRSDDERPGPSS